MSLEQNNWICSSGFAVFNPFAIPSEYLVAYLRLAPVCELMDAYTTATMYPAISVRNLLGLPVFVPTQGALDAMCQAVQQVRNAYIEAARNIEEAKSIVERALTLITGPLPT